MNEPAFTRCPGCATVFRVSAEQLALREGQVRCGHCRAVFDANDHRVALGAAQSVGSKMPVEPEESPPVATEVEDTSPDAASKPDAEDAKTDAEAGEAETEAAATEAAASETASGKAEPESVLRAERFEWKPRKPLRERPRVLYAVALALLVVALFAQALLEYRDALAAHAPFTRPVLDAACGIVGCVVGPLRDAAALSIEASDLQADPAHRGLLKLTATIRNRASYAIAWPHVELSLTDASDRVVARRAFTPAEYAGGAPDAALGIPGNGERVLTLFLDASATSQAGYRLYLFYP
jgi:predicted Zn finger-like uncharacterized protein